MSGTHSMFAPSASHRILLCPPSCKLNAELPDTAGAAAQEGTCAHELCAYLVEHDLGRDVKDPTANLDFYDAEMQSCAEGYRDYVLEQYEAIKRTCPDAQLFIEQHVDISRWVPGCGGTADCIILADGMAEIIDFKYGTGVPVSATTKEFGGNPQLMCYALGMVNAFAALYDFDRIKLAIFQPRLENISEHELSLSALLEWGEKVLSPTAKLALAGEGEFCAGDHCRFCKVKAACRKRAEYNLEMAQYDFAPPSMLTDTEIEAILDRADGFKKWVGDIEDYALKEALAGKTYERYMLTEGRSNRRYTSDADVAEAVTKAGYDAYKPREVMGITDMEKQLGKKKFNELLGKLVYKPQGKPTLVPRSSGRPELKTTAQDDFKE